MADHFETLWIKGLTVLFFQVVTVVIFFPNKPLFTNDTYTIHQQEEVLGEADMMNITADDADSGSNSMIDYAIENGDISKYGKRLHYNFLP